MIQKRTWAKKRKLELTLTSSETNVIAVGTSGFPTTKILNQEYAQNAKAHTGIDQKNGLTKKVGKNEE